MADLSRLKSCKIKYIFIVFKCKKSILIDYNLCSVMTSLKIFDIFDIVIVSN